MPNTNRDKYLCQDYRDGKEINELARSYGISERRVAQILRGASISLRPRSSSNKKALSAKHVQIGLHLYQYRFDKCIDAHAASLNLGWSMLKVRKVEKGKSELELLDLMDIATFTETDISMLLK